MAVVGNAEIRIQPTTTGFEAALRSQLTPILSRVEAQMGPLFQRAGKTSADAFSREFSRTLGTQLSGAVSTAAGARGVTDAGRTAGLSFGRGLTVAAGDEVGRNLSAGVQKATASVQRQVRAAGEQSGRTFGGGFGEGFAALAAFAIAARVGRFFRETVTAALEFETAFAGARRVIEGTPEDFSRLNASIVEMSERLPFAAKGIADVAAEAGRLGVPLANIESFTETVLKFATITAQAPDAVATSFAKFATVTKTPLTEIEGLADTVLKLGTAFAANEAEVLEFSRRLTPLAALTRATGEEILALSTSIVQAGGRAESGGSAITQAFNLMQKAAEQGGDQAEKFAQVIGVETADAFQRLLEVDPTEAFVRLLEGVRSQGASAVTTLDDLGLGSIRVSTALRQLSAASDEVRKALGLTEGAAGELDRQFAIFGATAAVRLQILQNTLENTRIEIGSKLAPAIVSVLTPISNLSTGAVTLAASFAGLAAASFAFQRFRNIFAELSRGLGGGALSAEELAAAMRIASTQGTTLGQTLRIAAAEGKSLAQTEELLAASDKKLTAAFQQTNAQVVTRVQAFRQLRAETTAQALTQAAAPALPPGAAAAIASQQAAQRAQAVALQAQIQASARIVASTLGPALNAQTAAFNASTNAIIRDTQAKLANAAASNVANQGLLGAARGAITATGGFGALIGELGKLSLILIGLDFATQGLRFLFNQLDTLARGAQDIDAVTESMKKLFTELGKVGEAEALNKVFEDARISVGGFREAAISVGEEVSTSLVNPTATAIRLLGDTLENTGIPGVENLGSALRVVGSTVLDVTNRIPLLGRFIKTETERAQADLADLAEGLDALFAQSPTAARAIFEVTTEALREQGRSQKDINAALGDFKEKLDKAAEGEEFLKANSDKLVASLREQGLTEAQVAEEAAGMGISLETAGLRMLGVVSAANTVTNSLQRLLAAQSAFQQRVSALIVPVSGLIEQKQKLAKASKGAGTDSLRSARAIADAERALADARKDAARRLADAQRRLAEAEEDAADRIVEARRRIEDARIDSTRSLRDAQQELQDFERSLAVVGGARTIEDEIRLRELRERLADETIDAQRREAEGQADLAQIEEDNAERIADAQRKLRETHEENADKIADALRRLARAHEDAANRQGAAADKMAAAAEKVSLSIREMTRGFSTEAAKLNTFSSLMETAAQKVTAAFGDRALAEGFLFDLNEMGVAAIPILKNLVNASDKELKGLGKAFKNQVKAAKKAADFEFAKYEPNFKAAMRPAINAAIAELDNLITAFEDTGGAAGPMADKIEQNLALVASELFKLLAAAGQTLTPLQSAFLHVANKAEDAGDQVQALKDLINSLKPKTIDVTANLQFDIDTKQLERELKALVNAGILPGGGGAKFGATIHGPLADIPKMHFGGSAHAGEPILVGRHTAEELFIPSTSGAIFKHSDTNRILDALRVGRKTVIQNVVVNQVGDDPLATARAVSFRIGSDRAIR